MDDLAQYQANAYSEPLMLPGQLTIDLLTLTKTNTSQYVADGVGISQIYALEIGNMVAPSGTLPASFPTATGSMEWFIEGISETISQDARTIQFYTSPASNQRAWKLADPVYGILGKTSMIGLSAPDLNPTQALGKNVSHDAGPPY